ncbi:MAG: ribosome-binding factor A [Candidatus Liptonbacteria bacterium RIFCSPLOWO2_01_FULL_53_13]|uniref:Ribosome-binding factor A n=1 Tax=Candidatus Liptonbacteria bacterium RIFCSPLOWO2_01_FULL_53_13 TaxID=1798651 RepID=A0A1G2CMV9_9BACT|nr:MAG: ribosome-binding factor A [Candidatus Liptonbacteria bacterium RIFCSPLOWO2_01_FULL_53_13]
MNYRPLRVANLIQEELGNLLLREFDAQGAIVTITGVVVEHKLETATVKVSILPPEKAKETLKALIGAQGKLQYLLLRKINIYPMPRIHFEIDLGVENAARVEKILLEHPDEDSDENPGT